MNTENVQYQEISQVPEALWMKLSEKSIYFGHQSVGFNILNGMEGVLANVPQAKLTFKETYDPEFFLKGQLSHSRIGYNGDPLSKLNMFAFFAKFGGAESADIMFFKFCYVDFNRNTNVDDLFLQYANTYKILQDRFPDTIFIHITVPLTTIQSGPKTWLKNVLKKPIGGTTENMKRHQFNEMMRNTYGEFGYLFDLAAYESTLPDGRENVFQLDNKAYPYLVPEYTNDGGHLNQTGRERIGGKLLLFLLNTMQKEK